MSAASEGHAADPRSPDPAGAAPEGAKELPPRFRVTCPQCGAFNVTEWTDVLPPGGVAPVRCVACGYMILSESEGNPVEVPAEHPRGERSAVGDPTLEGGEHE